MQELIDVLVKLWQRKYWILGITLIVMSIGIITKIPSIKKKEKQATVELQIINIPQSVNIDFNKRAIRFVDNEVLSKKLNIQNQKITVSFGKNKSICFSTTNSNQERARNVIEEVVKLFNQEINTVVNEFTLPNINKINYLIMLKQQQIDSIKKRLTGFYEQPQLLTAERKTNMFAEETMLANCILDLNNYINDSILVISQTKFENKYVTILSYSESENTAIGFQILKFFVGFLALGLFVSISWFLIWDLEIIGFKSFWKQFLNQMKLPDKTI